MWKEAYLYHFLKNKREYDFHLSPEYADRPLCVWWASCAFTVRGEQLLFQEMPENRKWVKIAEEFFE